MATGYQLSLPGRLVAGVMAFGSGVLLSAVSFELIAEAEDRAGLLPAVLGAVIGALLYSGANVVLARRGARHRKRSGTQQAAEGGGSSGIAVVTAMFAAGGFLLAGVLAPFALASVTALAGGAILAMIADTMIPKAFEQAHLATGLITVLGFLAAFALSRIGG